jgi:nucleoside-diphosphate-sugar epimerase
MENKRVLVIGGTGYIGKVLVKLMSTLGYDITVLSRKKRYSDKYNVKFLQGTVLDKEFLKSNMKDFDMVLYLAAIIRTTKKKEYDQNPQGLKNTIQAMHHNNLKKILFYSSVNALIPKTGPYGNSKKMCENLLAHSGLDYIIVRPNYVYGVDKENDFFKLFTIMKKTKMCPVLGNGKNKIQPINKMDLAKITVEIINHWDHHQIVNISGKKTISINKVTKKLMEYSNNKALRVHAPISILKIFKRFLPFDIDGYDDDRIAPLNEAKLIGNADFDDDLKNIVRL